MENKDDAVKAEAQKAAAEQGVKKDESQAPKTQEEIDYVAQLEETKAELVRVRQERENYKKGLLKAKGKISDDETDEDDIDARIERKVSEKLLAGKEAEIIARQESIIKSASQKIKELTTALQNRGQITNASSASSSEGKESTQEFWSKEQLAYFKSRGLDPEKVKANYLRTKSK